jgi:hypothetical protein
MRKFPVVSFTSIHDPHHVLSRKTILAARTVVLEELKMKIEDPESLGIGPSSYVIFQGNAFRE